MQGASTENETTHEDSHARARDHAYLPTSHPLHTTFHNHTPANNTSPRPPKRRTSEPREMAVLELPGVFLFPGSAFPLRFSSSDQSPWIAHLSKQIQASRLFPSQSSEIRLGILFSKPPPDLERIASLDRRRQSWTRQGFGPERLRRLSQQLIQEIGSLDELDESESDDDYLSLMANDRFSSSHGSNTDVATSSSFLTRLRSGRKDRCGYLGRIGTVVTVMSTHGDEQRSTETSLWSGEENELVLTTMATARFRIVDYCNPNDEDRMYQRAIRQRRHTRRSVVSSSVPKFLVQVLEEELVHPPSCCLPLRPSATAIQNEHDELIRKISILSPLPEFVLKRMWPWRILGMIKEEIARNDAFRELLQGARSLNDRESLLDSNSVGRASPPGTRDEFDEEDPLAMSFWLASNLPFSESEKLQLLEMPSTVERLQFIHVRIQEHNEPIICCQTCGVNLSCSSSMFTVGGAEGTTGAYVNVHGIVHQTVTVRQLLSLGQNPRTANHRSMWMTNSDGTNGMESDVVAFVGSPQTQDSWFPGYSWTCMFCSLCDSHLGWKFLRVDRTSPPSLNRPDMFFGLSGASISVVTMHGRRRGSQR